MSIKSLIQIVIIIIITIILGSIYYKYFSNDKMIIEEISELSSNINLDDIKKTDTSINETNLKSGNDQKNNKKEKVVKKKKKKQPDDLIKEVEYLATDRKGNKS